MEILKVKYAKPIEREFEAWIIAGMEEYFKTINKKVRIFAISPALESTFPADEILNFDYKILGLQFKKASLSGLRKIQTSQDYSNIHWTLNNPAGQFELVQRMSEIYYCLPTFINRDYKNASLNHCLFWRPGQTMAVGPYWYNNPNARGTNNTIIEPNALRWGQFIERIYECSIGRIQTARQITVDIFMRTLLNDINENESEIEGLYALVIEM